MANSTIVSNAANLKKYLDLPQKGNVMAEYVWIDGSNGIRSKSKVSHFFHISRIRFSIRRIAAFLAARDHDPA
jgi:hypothetical protein